MRMRVRINSLWPLHAGSNILECLRQLWKKGLSMCFLGVFLVSKLHHWQGILGVCKTHRSQKQVFTVPAYCLCHLEWSPIPFAKKHIIVEHCLIALTRSHSHHCEVQSKHQRSPRKICCAAACLPPPYYGIWKHSPPFAHFHHSQSSLGVNHGSRHQCCPEVAYFKQSAYDDVMPYF